MVNKIKLNFLTKFLPVTKYTNSYPNIKKSRNVHVTYNHEACNFLINILNDKKANNEVAPVLNSSEELKIIVDREKFIKHFLEDIVRPKSSKDYISKNIVIDFSSPNIAKPFHVGHLRSTIIGNFLANIHKYYDNEVTKINYLGDWGTQFGLLQYGLKAKNLNINELKIDPIKKLFEAYVYANKLSATNEDVQNDARRYFADIEQGKTDLASWKQIREVTVGELEKIYQRLGITFDCYHWESDYNSTAITGLMTLLEQRNIIESDDTGKKVAKINNKNITILKSDNSTLYVSRDIAALIDRYEKFKFNEMLYIVDNSQTDHFSSVFEIVRQINPQCIDGCKHIKFGRVKGMSTRSGNVIFLNDILDEAKEKMFEKQKQSKNTRSSATNETTCDILGTSAVIINDLKQSRLKDYIFNWDKALQSEGDSGIKLQYLHCRLWSLEQNSNITLPDVCDPKYLPEEIVGDVVAELVKFENILQRSINDYEACIIVNYLFRLAKYVNRMINELRVKDTSTEVAGQRLLVFYSARQIIKLALELLGVKPLNEM